MEQNIPVPSSESSPEGAPKAASLLGPGSSSGSSLAEQPVVPTTAGNVRELSPVPGPSSVPDGP